MLSQWVTWMTLNHLTVRLQFWSFGECRVPLHCHYPQVYSMSQTELFNYSLYLKPFNCVQTKWALAHLKILSTNYALCCLNFWDEAWWFLSLRVFRLLSSSLLLFPQHFSLYVLWPSSGVGRTREPSRNSKLRPLLNPRG